MTVGTALVTYSVSLCVTAAENMMALRVRLMMAIVVEAAVVVVVAMMMTVMMMMMMMMKIVLVGDSNGECGGV